MKKISLALASISAFASAIPAQAAVIDAVYSFEATFTSGPNAKIDGTFILSLDPQNSSVPVTFKSFSSQALAGYTATSQISSRFVSLGNCASGCQVFSGQSQFYFYTFLDSSGAAYPGSNGLVYASRGKEGLFKANTVTVSRVTAAVPEPSTWALMILGFGAVGYAMRRRQKVAVRFA